MEEDGRLKRVGQKREGGGGLDRVGPRVGGGLDRVGPRREEGGRLKRVGQKGEGGRELDMMGRELGKEGDEGERIFEWYFY